MSAVITSLAMPSPGTNHWFARDMIRNESGKKVFEGRKEDTDVSAGRERPRIRGQRDEEGSRLCDNTPAGDPSADAGTIQAPVLNPRAGVIGCLRVPEERTFGRPGRQMRGLDQYTGT